MCSTDSLKGRKSDQHEAMASVSPHDQSMDPANGKRGPLRSLRAQSVLVWTNMIR